MSEGIDLGLRTWQAGGFAGLFVLLFLVLFGGMLWLLRDYHRTQNKITERAVTALESTAAMCNKMIEIVQKNEKSVAELTQQIAQLLKYLEGRDHKGR